ncbi:MAG: hypothetical protein M1818_001141 [Claussenomyces sp. TS43310]|nr:MAG: hypothetical protein M1818_001141 [Claussenomyces sp. TS43310]
MDALRGVATAVPQWQTLLDDLSGQISCRQAELAQVAESRPPTRSLKNQGSTESLKLKDGDEPYPAAGVAAKRDSRDLPSSNHGNRAFATPPTPSPSTPEQSAPPLIPLASHPGSSVQRQTSRRRLTPQSATKAPTSPPAIAKPPLSTPFRKRKTNSLASNTSVEGLPKFRTRSMIIVYYDSAVQNAFEELVKRISSSRNAMRKGKMAARMAEMRRVAELDAVGDDEDGNDIPSINPRPTDVQSTRTRIGSDSGNALVAGPIDTDDDEEDYPMPKLDFISTRRMGSASGGRTAVVLPQNTGTFTDNVPIRRPNMPNLRAGLRRGTRHMVAPGGTGSRHGANQNIFDELDAGLEWCQSMCEHAAHQFLRDGDCGIEIEGIKRRLGEVRQTAEREVRIAIEQKTDSAAKLEKSRASLSCGNENREHKDDGEADDESLTKRGVSFNNRKDSRGNSSREFKSIHMRKPMGSPGIEKDVLVADDMQVDDEGVEDMDMKLP